MYKARTSEKLKNSVVLSYVWVNWDRIRSGMSSALRNEIYKNREEKQRVTDKEQFLRDEKLKSITRIPKEQIIEVQVDFIIYLLKKSFPLIEKYFSLDEYGLPSLRFIELFLNRILGEQLIIKGHKVDWSSATFKIGKDVYTVNLGPQFNRVHDKYALLKDYEIHYLRQKLKELNPNINLADEMQKDGYDKHMYMLEKIIKLQDPVFYVSFDTNIKKTNIRKSDDFLKRISIPVD
ncbi:MAG: hypothetical protein NUK65_03555 [Firmicutes bacterium]|nr:hypothetical protein [Bacillota bacterium]